MSEESKILTGETGLLIIDIQKDYFPGGRMELVNPENASKIAKKLLNHFRKLELPVFHVNHAAASPGATFFVPGTEGIKVHHDVEPVSGEPVIIKHHPNSFLGTDLLEKLNSAGIKSLVITGMMTHMCIDATTRAASDLGFNCTVIYDACSTRDLVIDGRKVAYDKVHDAFLAALKGTYAEVMRSEEFFRKYDLQE